MMLRKKMRHYKKQTFMINIFLFILSIISLGYSFLTSELSISGTVNVSKTTWDVHFENIQITEGSGNSIKEEGEPTTPIISSDTKVEFSIGLDNPGEFYEFTVDIVNDGTLDAKLDEIEILPNLTNAQKEYFNYTVTYSDGIPIKKDDALNSGTTETILVRLDYLENNDTTLLPEEDVNLEISLTESYIQGKGNKVKHPVSFSEDDWDTIITVVKSGKTSVYHVGDTKEIDMGTFGTHTLRIANKSTPAECSTEEFSQTACGFVLEFADIITTHNMNSADINVGGWPASELRSYVNSDIYNALPEVLRNAIINTTVVSGYGSTVGETNFTSNDKLYLLSGIETLNYAGEYERSQKQTRQMDYYASQGITIDNCSGAIKQYNGYDDYWWLRSAYSYNNHDFIYISFTGTVYNIEADETYGVSPAFRIG